MENFELLNENELENVDGGVSALILPTEMGNMPGFVIGAMVGAMMGSSPKLN